MERRWATGRVEAFSDGVFAIAVTLLVLDIKIAPDAFDDLWRALRDEWPSYLAFVTSFLTVSAVWLAHHDLFARLRYVDPVLMGLHVALLLLVSSLPFPTALMAEAIDRSRATERTAVIVYGVVDVAIERVLAATRRHALRSDELSGGLEQPALHIDRRGPVYVIVYFPVVGLGVALLPKVAAFAYLVIAAIAVFRAHGEGRLLVSGTR